jgi:thioredoxin-dependent peroxiredoxin
MEAKTMSPHIRIVAAWLLLAGMTYGGDTNMTTVEFDGLVTMKGKPLTLLGAQVKVGDKAPEFKAVDASFKPVTLSDFKSKTVLISAVPSLDTGVCAAQTKRFNEEAAKLPTNVVILTISEDLPFAQKRFCETEKIGGMQVLSDSVWRDFGSKYGIVIKGMGLLSRSIWIVSPDGRIVYRELVKELSAFPDYDAALKALNAAAK